MTEFFPAIVAAVVAIVGVCAYFVRSSVDATASAKVSAAELVMATKFEALTTKLFNKIDELTHSVNSATSTLLVSDERLKGFDARLSAVERIQNAELRRTA